LPKAIWDDLQTGINQSIMSNECTISIVWKACDLWN